MQLDPAAAAASPLHGRVVLAVGEPRAGLVPGTGMFALGLERLVGNYGGGDASEGLAALVDEEAFLHATRRLTDTLLLAVHGARRPIVELVPAGAVGIARAVYPDATVRSADDAVARSAADGPEGHGRDDPVDAPATPRLADVIAASPMAGRLLVVLGAARSGTTWLEQLLLAHRQLGGVERTESFLFGALRSLWANRDGGGGLQAAPAGVVDGALRRFCDDVLTAALARHRPGATWFVEKTPLHTLLLGEIRVLYPDAAYLHIVRDGRDVARSMAEVDFFEGADVAAGARLWRRVVTTVRREAAGLTRYREIRYESLLSEPTRGATAIFEWLGLDPGVGSREALAERAGERVSVHGTSGPVGAGKWQALSPADLARIYRHAGDLLCAEGYVSAEELQRWRRRPVYAASAAADAVRGMLARFGRG